MNKFLSALTENGIKPKTMLVHFVAAVPIAECVKQEFAETIEQAMDGIRQYGAIEVMEINVSKDSFEKICTKLEKDKVK